MAGASRHRLLRTAVHRSEAISPRLGKRVEVVFGDQAAAHPACVATEYRGATLRYRALAEAANNVAAALQLLGIGPGGRVGISSRRSLHMVGGLLGILQAGASYVPLDPELPAARLDFLIRDAGLRVLVEHGVGEATALRQWFEPALTVKVESAPPCERVALPDINSADVAYVMYTSGSTGAPKGVEVRHDGIIRLVDNPNYMVLDSRTVMLQSSPLSFDASTLEIWGALLNGGRLVSYPDEPLSLGGIRRILEEQPVNAMFLSTRVFDRWVRTRRPDPCRLEHVVIGGEAASPTSVERFYEVYDKGVLVNGYGPTETTTFATCYQVPRGVQFSGSVPIGKAINHTEVFALDAVGHPVADGEEGELWIGGAGVAKGYLGQPELTAERFTTRPCSRVPGEILYRTGDMVRKRSDGNLEFLGRRDHQVKVRGHRVELGEVEKVIERTPGVQSCVVTAITEGSDDTRIVAYVTTEDTSTDAGVLQRSLAEVLPSYMIPSTLIVLDELPLNDNGKVDRRALPSPPSAPKLPVTAGASELADLVTQAWRSVLELPRVGVDDDFRSLGGDSLRAMSLALILEERLGTPVDLSTMGPLTIRGMCKALSGGINDNRTACLIDMQPSSDTLLVCFTGGGRELMMPPFDFLVSIHGLVAKRILLRDFRRAFYHHGVEGHSHDIDSTRTFLDREIARSGATRVVMLGTSMGGYAALLYGLLCAAHEVHGFAPVTALTPALQGFDAPGQPSWSSVLATLDGRYLDLAACYRATTAVPRCYLHVGEGNADDVVHAERLRGCRGVHFNYRPTAEHNIARYMLQRGELAELLKHYSEDVPG